ncbi:helix-turn-helix transcriptional regulator [Methylopila sp. M107]|uniref:LexA family transcriptional regulator n=1 Tax=Methylopila sp. M107 TaxID=1101190 RepID=UPI0009DBA80F|nr:helix-turn-helix transcriptional regulator [Methylopila sp. M107]
MLSEGGAAADQAATIADRLRELINGGSVNAFAAECGIPVATLRENLKSSIPNAENAAKIAKTKNVSLEWLVTGTGPRDRTPPSQWQSQVLSPPGLGDLTLIPRYDVRLSSGPGALVAAEEIFEHLAFRSSWLREMGISPKNAALVTNKGDSNEPTIPDGALMLLDLSITDVTNGKFYALNHDGELILKRVQRRVDGTVVLKSDNPRYDPEEVTPDRVAYLHVIGQLKWFARSI